VALGRGPRRPHAISLRRLGCGVILLALAACASQRVTVAPDPIQDITPIPAQVDPHLWTLHERWAAAGTSGEVHVGTVVRQILVDDPQAPVRLTYVTSQLNVRTIVSSTFDRPRAYEARYRLSVRVESSAAGVRQAWLEGRGESRSLASAARATQGAITQAVRELYRHLRAVGDARVLQGKGGAHGRSSAAVIAP
jgi:hypothetical protein